MFSYGTPMRPEVNLATKSDSVGFHRAWAELLCFYETQIFFPNLLGIALILS